MQELIITGGFYLECMLAIFAMGTVVIILYAISEKIDSSKYWLTKRLMQFAYCFLTLNGICAVIALFIMAGLARAYI